MKKIGVGVIGASPLRPGWALTAHLPAIAALPDYELRAVATSSKDSARAAEAKFAVPGFADPAALIARDDVDLVVITVKLAHHYRLVASAIAAGKKVMCEWPLGADIDQTSALADLASNTGTSNFIGLQARMAPSVRYARDLVAEGYVGEVLATTLVGSGIAWTSKSDAAHAYMFDVAENATLLSVPTMHAVDALQFVLGDLVDIRAASAVRRPVVTLVDIDKEIRSTTPDHLALAATLESGAIASIFYRGGVSRGDNLRWEINGSEGDLVLTSPVGNLQVLAPTLAGGRGHDTTVVPLKIPSKYDLAPGIPDGPSANVARLYAAFATDQHNKTPAAQAPDFAHALRLHRKLDAIRLAASSGISQAPSK
ncbi:Gfo/Idh/MocA family protein [Paraburkholderia guartelaensis]|uniref:Gfo/Idh/MocA family protein n=1 Tax=Paraburkholderia guartelaensis TaxID=2546446 RepID=UPI002AB69A65|nr:Gfo/Idh/MocA family oxidoreductase [Paraburkholderia guartelaensis]